ncbi:hypothetical protein PCANC_11332 [Puccinia coronata f. sp. avenae]|uniref:Uncharacterized protein n=1 Tax=Puccinia coronata f. sp. avenae TaxID=200324 RepID=A0A2N5SJK0_9BASI|nr:hypothetical protein PCANC_22199 [Puccinia coronata f. sp. avenae]PLW53129.1 hypothetical protein PCANC_11332 [Puccinia coronata f. sp. avenae]
MQSDSCQASRIGELKYPPHLRTELTINLVSKGRLRKLNNQIPVQGSLEEKQNKGEHSVRKSDPERLFFVLLISAIAPPRHFQRSTLKLNWHPHQIDRK